MVAILTISLEERDFALKAGIVYGAIHTMIMGEDTVQSFLVQEMQKELENNNFCRGNRERFLNAVFLMSELYFHLRSNDEPIAVLGGELLRCFFWLLTGQEGELEVLATCLIINGSDLKKNKPESYKRLMIEIRMTLIGRKISAVGRSWLLLILDMDNFNFSGLPKDLEHVYMLFIGNQGFQKFERMRFSPKPCSEEESETTSESASDLELSPKGELLKSPHQSERKCSDCWSKPTQLYTPPQMRESSHDTQSGPSVSKKLSKKLRALDRAIFSRRQYSESESDNYNDSSSLTLSQILCETDDHEEENEEVEDYDIFEKYN